MSCEHFNFHTIVKVIRIVTPDGMEYSAEVSIKCTDCGVPFKFLGLQVGLSFQKPMVSFGDQELRAPIIPGRLES